MSFFKKNNDTISVKNLPQKKVLKKSIKNIFELKWNFYFVLQIAHLKVELKNPLIKKAEAFLMNLSLNDEARVG